MRRAILLLAVAAAFLLPAFASLAAQVDGLQMPAWRWRKRMSSKPARAAG